MKAKSLIANANLAGQIGLALSTLLMWVIVNIFFQVGVIPLIMGWLGLAAFTSAYWHERVSDNQLPLFWMACAVGTSLLGIVMFILDIYFGFIQWPIPGTNNIWSAVKNPSAVLFSIAFFPGLFLVAIATAIRSWVLYRE